MVKTIIETFSSILPMQDVAQLTTNVNSCYVIVSISAPVDPAEGQN